MSELVRTHLELLNRASDAVGTASQESHQVVPATDVAGQSLSDVLPGAAMLSDDDQPEIRREKIAAIRRTIDSGAYDSDELLQVAVERMIHRLRDSEGST